MSDVWPDPVSKGEGEVGGERWTSRRGERWMRGRSSTVGAK